MRFLNVDIRDVTEQELLQKLRQGVLITPNVDQMVKLQRDRVFYDIVKKAQCYPRSATLFPSACQNGLWSAKAPFASCRVSRGMEELYVACYLMAQ